MVLRKGPGSEDQRCWPHRMIKVARTSSPGPQIPYIVPGVQGTAYNASGARYGSGMA